MADPELSASGTDETEAGELNGTEIIELTDSETAAIMNSDDLLLDESGQESVIDSNLVDPFGYVYDAITKTIISDAIVSLYQYDGTTLYTNAANQNPYTTSDDGSYSFLVEPGEYQIEASHENYIPYAFNFTQESIIALHQIDFYLAPRYELDVNGDPILVGGNPVATGISSGWVSLDGNAIINEDLIYPGYDLSIEAADSEDPFNSISVGDNVVISTRVLASGDDDYVLDYSRGDSGSITLTAPSIHIGNGAMILAHTVDWGPLTYEPGDITLTAYDIGGTDAFDLLIANTDSTDTEIIIGSNAVIKGNTVQMFATSDNTVVFAEDESDEASLMDQIIETGIEFLEDFDLIGGVAISKADAKISIGEGSHITADTFNAVSETRINASASPLGLGAGVAVVIGNAAAEVIVDGNITTTGDCYLKAKTDNTLQSVASASSVAGGVAFAVAVSVLNSDSTVQASSTSELDIGGNLTLEAETIDRNYTLARSKTGDDGTVGVAVAVSYENGNTEALLDGWADVDGDINVNALMKKEPINITKLFGSIPSAGTGVVASAGVNTSAWGDVSDDMQLAITAKVKTFVTTKVKNLVSSKSSAQQQDGQKTQGQTSPFELAAAVAICMDTNNVTARIGNPDSVDPISPCDPATVKSRGTIMVYACAESQPYVYSSGSISEPEGASQPPAGGSSDGGTKFAGSAAVTVGIYDNYVQAYIAEDASVDAAHDLIIRAEALNDWEFSYLLSAAQDLFKAYLGMGGSPTFSSSDGTVYVQTGNVVLVKDTHTAGGEAGHYYMYMADGSGDPFKELLTLSDVDYTGAKWLDLGSLEQMYSSDGETTCNNGDMIEVVEGHTTGGEAGHLYKYIGSVPYTGVLSEVDYTNTENWEDLGATWQYRGSEFVRTLSLYANSCFGLDNYVFNSMTQSTAKGAKVSICGAVTVLDLDGTAHAYIAENALINQDSDPLYRTGLQQVAVESKVVNETMHMGGNVELPGISGEGTSFKIKVTPGGSGVGGDTIGVGGTVLIITCDNESTAEIKEGVALYGDNLRVTADNKNFIVTLAASGGESGTFGFNGTFSLVKMNNTTLAIIDNGARVEVGDLLIPGTNSSLLVRANDDSFVVTISGGVAMAKSVGIGASIAINEIVRDTEAYIGNPLEDLLSEGKPVSAFTVSSDGPILVEAANGGYIGSFALAAAVVKEKTPDDKKQEAPEGGGSFGLGASAEVVLNEIKDDALAYIHDAALQSTNLVISSNNRTKILAAGGSMAIVTTKGTSVGLAGSYAQNTIDNRTKSFTDNSDLQLSGDFKAEADAGEKIFSFAASGAASTSSNSVSVAGQVSINSISSATGASILNQSNIIASNVTLKASDSCQILAIAGALAYGGKGGIGAAVALNDIPLSGRNAVTSSIENSDVDASGYIDMDASSENQIFSITAALGASKEGMAAAASVSINTIATDVNTNIIGKKSTGVVSDGALTMDAVDTSSIFSISGAVALSGQASLGLAVAYNEIDNTVQAYVGENAYVSTPASFQAKADSNADIKTIAVGGGYGGKLSLTGSIAINNINNDVLAYISNATVSADTGVLLDASNDSNISAIAGAIGASSQVAIGAAVAVNNIGCSSEANNTQDGEGNDSGTQVTVTSTSPTGTKSYIYNSKVTSSTGPVTLTAVSDSSIKNITVAGGFSGKVAINGAVSVNNIFTDTETFIKDCPDNIDPDLAKGVIAQGGVTLISTDNAAISAITCNISIAGSAGCGAAVAINNIGSSGNTNLVTASIENSQVTSEEGGVSLTATSNAFVFNITAGAGAGGTAGVQGSVSINSIYSEITAQIITGSVVQAKDDITLTAESLERKDAPLGVMQVEDDDTTVSSYDGDGNDDPRDFTSIQSLAGAIAGGGTAGIGAAVATNNVSNSIYARITDSSVTSDEGNVSLAGTSGASIETISAAIAGSGTFSLAAGVSTNSIHNEVLAYIFNSTVTSSNNSTPPEGEVYGVILTAEDTSIINSCSGQFNFSGTAGIGAAVAVNEIHNTVKAYTQNSIITTLSSLTQEASSTAVIKTIAAGGGVSQYLSLTGSVAKNTVSNDVLAYIIGSTVSADKGVAVTSSNDSEIGAVAGAVSISIGGSVGAAIAINDIGCISSENDSEETGTQVEITSTSPSATRSYIENSKITATSGTINLSAVSNSQIKAVAAAGGGGFVAVNGAITVNNIYTNTEAYITGCQDNLEPSEKYVTADGDITISATDNSAASVIAGNVSVGIAGAGAALSTVNIGSSIQPNQVRAYIQNSRVTSTNGAISLEATSSAFIFNIASGVSGGGVSIQGSVAINNVYTDIAALINTGSDVSAKNDVSLSALSQKRETIPQGMLQAGDSDVEVSTFDGDTTDQDDDGQATNHTLKTIQSLAGGVAGGGCGGLGAAVATNNIANKIQAGIVNSKVTSSEGNVILITNSEATLETVSAAIANGSTFALAGAVSLNNIDNQVLAYMTGSEVTSNNTSNEIVEGEEVPGITIQAIDSSTIRSLAGQLSISSSAGIGGAAAYNEINNTVKAFVDQGTTGSILNTTGSVLILASSVSTIDSISAGGSFSCGGSVAGSVSINLIGNITEAYIVNSTANADDNIYLLADSESIINGYGGAMAGGLVGVGAAVVVNTVENTTRAYVDHAVIEALGTGDELNTKDWTEDGTESNDALHQGLAIIADCDDVITMYSGALSGGMGAVSGQVSVNKVADLTEAYIASSTVNSADQYGELVKVIAHQGTDVDIYAGGLAIGGTAIGAAVDHTSILNRTAAFISNADESGNDTTNVDSVVYANGVEVKTVTKEDVDTYIAGAALAGGVSVAGSVSVVDIDCSNDAYIKSSDVFSNGNLYVLAYDTADINTITGAVSLSGFAGAGGAAAVNSITNQTKAQVIGSDLNATGAIEIKAKTSDTITTLVGTAGVGATAGLAGAVSVNSIDTITEAVVRSGSVRSNINQNANFKPGGMFAPDTTQTVTIKADNTSTIDNTGGALAGGLYAGVGATIDVASIKNRTVARIGTGTKIYAKGNVNVEARSNKTIESSTTTISGGLVGISGAISVITIGSAADSRAGEEFNRDNGGKTLLQQLTGDINLDALSVSNDGTAQRANGKLSGLSTPDVNGLLSTTQDNSSKITAAYIESATGTSSQVVIVSDGDVLIKAINTSYIKSEPGQAGIGLAGAVGASIGIVNSNEKTIAYIGDYGYIRAANLTVNAESNETALVDGSAVVGGVLFGVGANIARVTINPEVTAYTGSYSDISTQENIEITATVVPKTSATMDGIAVSAGIGIGVSDATAQVNPVVTAYIGNNSSIVAGSQPMTGNPTLTFTTAAILSGTPTLVFQNNSATLTGNPSLTFTPDATNGDTITRSTGSWLTDNFQIGDYIRVSDTSSNNGIYQVASVSAATLNLVDKGDLTSETVNSGAQVYTNNPPTITRSSGNWNSEGFYAGQLINVTGTANNNGYYEIWNISANGLIMYLDPSESLGYESVTAGPGGAAIKGELNDRIGRNTGSWTADGFQAGQVIRIAGTTSNDGSYVVNSISADGKYLILESEDEFIPETATNVIITIPDLIASEVTVNARQFIPATGNTAAADAFGCSGGTLYGHNSTQATADNTSTVKAYVGQDSILNVAGLVDINAFAFSKTYANGDAYNGGLLAFGNNVVQANSDNTTQAYLNSGVDVEALELRVTAYDNSNNNASAKAGAGGVVAGMGAEAETSSTSSTTASIGSGNNIKVEQLLLTADHTANFNSKVSTITVSAVDTGGGEADNQVNASVAANIGDNTNVEAYNIIISASNRSVKNWLSGSAYNADSISGGLASVPAIKSNTDISHTTAINVGSDASLKVIGDRFDPGALTLNALNSVYARDKVRLNCAGAVAWARAESIVNADALDADVTIGAGADLTSVGDINLSARTIADIETSSYARTTGAAGAGEGKAKSYVKALNDITILGGQEGNETTLFSEGEINLLAGRNSADQINTYNLKADTLLDNYTAIPFKTSPYADSTVDQTNNITVNSRSLLECVKDANLLTESGITVLHGEGIGNHIYRDLIDDPINTLSSTIDNKSTVRVDGTIKVGIRNRQALIINSDGTIEEQSEGVTFTRKEDSLSNALLQELDRLLVLSAQYSGTEAGAAFDAEIAFLMNDLEAMGNIIYVNGTPFLQRDVTVEFIVVDDVWAQSANINVTGDYLLGSGSLQAPGNTEIIITNNSPAYLRVNRLNIPATEGGSLVFNGDNLTNNSAIDESNRGMGAGVNFSSITTSATSAPPLIEVSNNYNGLGRNPDIQLMGEINNVGQPTRLGIVRISSTGSISSLSDINAGELHIDASGNFTQSYIDTYYNVGGEPRIQWGVVSNGRETDTRIRLAAELTARDYPSDYNDGERSSITTYINTVILNEANRNNQDPERSEIRAANVFIAAKYLNINGMIEAGHAMQEITLGNEINYKIAQYKAKPTLSLNYLDYLLVQKADMKFYYDPVNDCIVLEDVNVHGGYIELFGQILSTGTGKVVALDGYGTININNQTNYSLAIQSLDTGTGSHGVIKITDTSKTTEIGGETFYRVTQYNRVYNTGSQTYSIQTRTCWSNVKVDTAAPTTSSGSTSYYNPTTGYRYVYVNGQDAVEREKYLYRSSDWLGFDCLSRDPDDLEWYERITVGAPIPLENGEYLVYEPGNSSQPYMYWYESINLSTRTMVYQHEWSEKSGFLNLGRTYYVEEWFDTGVKDVHYHSVKADYPILIEFAGGLEGIIIVQSSHDIILEGPITNRLGQTTLIAGGSIEQTSDSVIASKNITLDAGTGIGNSLAILIDLLGGTLNADTDTGNVNIREVSLGLKLGSVSTGDGNVYLTAPTNMEAASGTSLVKGNLVDLTAGGHIGTGAQPLRIDTGDSEGSGIKAAAGGDIHLKEIDGTLPVFYIASTDGSVFITTVDGGLTDADAMRTKDTITTGELLGFWTESGIIGSGENGNLYTAADINQLLLKSLQKPLADTEYRFEDLNISGNDITLNVAQGIGDVRTFRLDFTEGTTELPDEARLMLAAAERGDVIFYDADDNPVDPASGTVAYMIISVHEDVDIEAAGKISVQAGSNVYLGSEEDVNLHSLTGGNTRIKSGAGIYGAAGSANPLITCDDLVLEAADGAIGTTAKPISIAVRDAGSRKLTARSSEEIYLTGVASGGQPGAFNIDFIYSPAPIKIVAAGFIRDANADSMENINADSLDITAGTIGSSSNRLEIKLAADGLLKAIAAAGGIYMEELLSDINVLEVTTSTGDVVLKAAGSILDAQDEQAGPLTNIAGLNINLIAVNGGVGTADNYLEINSANGGAGKFSADSHDNIYIKEQSGDLTLNQVVSDAMIYLISPGNILNGASAGYNVDGTKFWFATGAGVGTEAAPLQTRINNIEGTAGTGPVWVINTGGLNVGGIEAGTNGINAGGAVYLTAQSPITVAEDIMAGAEVVLTSTDSPNTGDNITVNSGVTVQSNGGITMNAGDDIFLVSGSLLNAINGAVALLGDYGNADSGVGSTVDIKGTILALDIDVTGNTDDDIFNLDVRTLSCPVTMLGGNGNDSFNIHLLPDLTTYHNDVRDTVTLDGQEGADVYTIDVTSSSDNIINVWDTGTAAGDVLNINGTSGADNFLLREKFIAVLQGSRENGYADAFERINYDSQIENLIINSLAGDDSFYLDDNCTLTEINGGDDSDFFQIGQMFGSARVSGDETGILTGDEIRTVHTTRGYLSRGISEETTINGGEGGDTFSVYSNLAPLDLNGDNGNDMFMVRAFALAEGETESQEMTNVYGGDGDDVIAYHINAPVDIDGGNGYDTLIVIGTEFGDAFIVTADGVFGAGLNVVFCNVEAVDIDGMEGDDHFFVQSTNSSLVTRIFGGLGNDNFYINGDVIEAVVTSNPDLIIIVPHDLASIAGPLYIFGGVDEGADRTVQPGVILPYESDVDLPEIDADVDETEMQDALYVYHEDAGSSSGTLTAENLSGLGMGTDLTLNTGTEDIPNWITYKGGITYQDLEIMEILLGAEDDEMAINDSAAGTITAVHGGGGSDTITVFGNSGPLVIYGDSQEDGSRYSSDDAAQASWYAHSFSNPGSDIIDASASVFGVIVYGGPGDDDISGSQGGDHLAGGLGIDTIYGEDGNDIIYGDSGFNVDLWNRVIAVPTTEAVSSDTIYGGSGNDIVFGDHGIITQTGRDAGILTVATTGEVDVIETTNISTGGDDTINGDAGDDILIGGSGTDTISGDADQDLIFGDNVRLAAGTGSNMAYTRYRMLTGDTIYDADDNALIGSEPQAYSGLAPFWSGYEITVNNDGAFGDDILSGGDGNDMIFGQSGNDLIRGGNHDDYIEGGCGNDTIFGDLGQDDIIGGNSNLFGLTEAEMRQDGGDTIYGGSGTDLARNTMGDETADGHAADADVILGDNGNIYRLVDSEGNYLIFNYDNYSSLKIVPRAVTLIDYTPGGPDYNAVDAAFDIGGNDIIHGEAGDDVIYGMTGNDILYGEGQDDDLIGGWGNDWISGGTGDDGILGDDGRIYTSRNGTAEPLYGIAATIETEISGAKTLVSTIYITGQLNKSVNLTPFNVAPTDYIDGDPVFFDPLYADDIIYGGLGNDFLHGGSGDDAISGAEALPVYYDNPRNVGDVLKYDETTTLFAAYNPSAPMQKIMVDENGNWVSSGGMEFLLNFETAELDGNDVIFGDLGNDWLVGGPGRDQLFGGFGDDLLNADDDHDSAKNNTDADSPPPGQPTDYYDDTLFGGGGRDVLIASSEGDRMVDWTGEYNSYIVPSSKFGPGTVIRYSTKAIESYLYLLAISSGADASAGSYVDGADPARYYEPYGEIGLVTVKDPYSKDMNGAPRDPQPGNKGGTKDKTK
ncbi:hypothetical protein ASZ90_017119 [hydrocarbon metagenome]|uniref:Uncharacterized protein n=1 Tax=hydrocarbon metagenome TaxID=938273 RepID=A0A0W8EAB0_9ZZZZ